MTFVTFDGQIGAGGSSLGRRISVMHDLRYVDRVALPTTAPGDLDARRASAFSDRFWRIFERAISGLALGNSAGDPYFATPETVLLPLTWDDSAYAPKGRPGEAATPDELLSFGRVALVDRAGAVELRDAPGVLKVGLFSSWEHRVKRVMQQEGMTNAEMAGELISVREKAQRNYFSKHHGADPEDHSLYDLVLDTSRQSLEMAVLAVSRRIRELHPVG